MKHSALTVLGTVLLLTRAPGTILLNEIHINVPDPAATGTDANFEFIELRSTTDAVESCDGLTILIIDNNGGQVGEVKEALNLTGLSTGPNGLLMIGDDYDKLPAGGPWSGFKDLATTTGDPSGTGIFSSMGSDDIGPNGGLTILLVTGWTGLTNFTGSSLGDVDVDPNPSGGNSVADWTQGSKPAGAQTTQPYATLVDSVGFRDLTPNPDRLPYCPSTADLSGRAGSAPNFPPDTFSRRLTRATSPTWANNSAAWYGANIAGTARDGVAYDVEYFGDFKGQATPGKPNLDAAPVIPNFLINEVSINPAGTSDGNNEFVEIINTVANAGTFTGSLQGYALLLIGSSDGNGGADRGKILEAWDLGGFSTGANGLLLLGNDYPSGFSPWGKLLDPTTQLADPEAPPPTTPPTPIKWSSLGAGDLGDNNGFTLLLVQNYSGTIGQDLDANNDGIFDAAPPLPFTMRDSIGFDQVGGAGKSYATAKIVTAPPYDPDLVARKLGNTTANSAAAWYGGDFGGFSPALISLKDDAARPVFGGFRGAATPGNANLNAAPPAGPIKLNEVQLDPVISPDGSYEYIELLSTTFGIAGMTGLTLVIANAEAGGDNGRILESIDLSPLATGPNGLLIVGDNFDNISAYDIPQKLISPLTNREDPPGLDSANDIGPNNGLAILLVKGTKPAVDSNVSAIAVANIVDSIGFGAVGNAGVALVSPGFNPDNISRYPTDQTANSPGAWFSGELDPAGGDASVTYGSNSAGAYKGGASPGRYNPAATPNAAASLLLNEINLNPPGGDNEKEFIEYRSSTSQAMSANGYTLLLLDVDGASTGTVLEAWSLDGLATGSTGLLLTGTGYTTALPWVGTSAPSTGTTVGSPAGMDFDDIGGATNNGATTLLLVRYFSGKVGDDLDTSTPPAVDDGVLDATPWNALVDAAGVKYWDATALPPPGQHLGRVYGGVDLSQTAYTPDNLSRYRDNTTALTTSAWYGADIAGAAGTSVSFDATQKFPAGPFIGRVTPGQPNVPSLAYDAKDDDGDGASNLMEEALGMNTAVSDADKLPTGGTVEVTGVTYPTLSFTRLTGGTAAGANKYSYGGLLYTVQFSTTLATWSDDAELVSAGSSSGSPPFELATYRPTSAAFAQGQTAGQMFLRLKVARQ